jgi:hypothetical protein
MSSKYQKMKRRARGQELRTESVDRRGHAVRTDLLMKPGLDRIVFLGGGAIVAKLRDLS